MKVQITSNKIIDKLLTEFNRGPNKDKFSFPVWLHNEYGVYVTDHLDRYSWANEEWTFPSEEVYFLFLMEWS